MNIHIALAASQRFGQLEENRSLWWRTQGKKGDLFKIDKVHSHGSPSLTCRRYAAGSRPAFGSGGSSGLRTEENLVYCTVPPNCQVL